MRGLVSEKKLMQIIAKQTEIKNLQQKFAERLKEGRSLGFKKLGFQGGTEKAHMYFFEKHNLWWGYLKLNTRYWNAFGISDNPDKSNSSGENIICEINFPRLNQSSWKPQGAFVKNYKKIYLAHTGKLNGPRHDGTNCTRDAFTQYTANELDWEEVYWYNGQKKKVTIISNLDDKDLIAKISQFVEIVYRFKKGKSSQDHDENEEHNERVRIAEVKKMSERDKFNLLKNGSTVPNKHTSTMQIRGRDDLRIEAIKEDRGYKCQICHIGIKRKNKPPYVEGAHIRAKAKGGDESPSNIMILCPNHHIEFDESISEVIDQNKNKVTIKLDGKMHTLDLSIQKLKK